MLIYLPIFENINVFIVNICFRLVSVIAKEMLLLKNKQYFNEIIACFICYSVHSIDFKHFCVNLSDHF